jgi:3-deoxy-D-manno-octulosonic-acid transferase
MLYLSQIIYNLGIILLGWLINISALWNDKSKAWIQGRKNLPKISIAPSDKHIWIHCASHGEFEQARPIIKALKQKVENLHITISFFSPAGYEMGKNYKLANSVIYLPLDTRANAKRIIKLLKPDIVIMVKYEFWINLLSEFKSSNIPVFLISARFMKRHVFFKWYGMLFRKALTVFDHIFLQNNASALLLYKIGIKQHTVSGDTRMDRVISLSQTDDKEDNYLIEEYRDKPILVFGSIWPDDWQRIKMILPFLQEHFHLIIAPHEIHEKFIRQIEVDLELENVSRYIEFKKENNRPIKAHLILNTVGRLGFIYQYAQLAYVGGAFGQGLHNILEPAAFGIPVIFGKDYHGFEEAYELIREGGAFSISKGEDLKEILYKLLNSDYRNQCGNKSKSYIYRSSGSSEHITNHLTNKLNTIYEMG